MNERKLHPLEYLTVVKRRRRWMIVPLVACTVGGALLAFLLPTTYRTSAMIGVAAPAVSPDLVPARAALDREERLRALSQQLRSPAVLERVAREEGLAVDRPVRDVAQSLQANISVEVPKPIAKTDRGPELNAFEIVYRDGTADRAQRVATRLAHVFVEENSRSREQQAEGTAEFLAAQVRATEERIANLEKRLRTAKEAYMGQLPEQTPANLATVSGLRQQFEATSNSLRAEQDRLSLIERQIDSVRQGLYAAATNVPGLASTPQGRVVALERELAAARGKYTAKHPEIQHLEAELASARAEVEEVRRQPASSRQQMLVGDPAYQQLDAERSLVQLRIRALRRAEGQLQSDIVRYQQRVEAAPMVEQEMASLAREYDLARENYKQLSERHAAALVQEQIARTRGGERFSVLSQAYLPDAPESPNRPRVILLSLLFGIALGGGLALAREYLDWSVRDARLLQDEFDVPVLAEIPRLRRVA
jgi:polysaccharide chain length determinant protein (PEP-CTERM system associated)